MKEVRVLKYQAIYPGLNKKLFVENLKGYRTALIHIRMNKLQDSGMKMLKVGKPNHGGTKIAFVPVKAKEYMTELKKIISEGKEIGVEAESLDKITTEMMEYVCDNLCRYLELENDEESLAELCNGCRMKRFVCGILEHEREKDYEQE